MPNFEQPPAPPQEPSEETEKLPATKEQEAQGVITRLGADTRRWKEVYVASILMGQFASSGIELVKWAHEQDQARAREAAKLKKDHEPGHEVGVRFEEMRALDPEASPERIRLILDTLPEGFVEGEVISIGFNDEVMPARADYHDGVEGKEAAATAAGGTKAERTVITFWRGSKDESSEWVWGDAMIHEVAHANDWENDQQLDETEKADLKKRVIERVRSADRYKSSYVESIKNSDPKTELENKAKEYWAEIVAAYLNGTLDPFGPDGTLVAEYIAKNDPEFDRGASLARRKLVMAEMTAEENVSEYAALPQAEKEAVEAWHAWRSEIMVGGQDPEMQRRGRLELIEAFKRWGATPEGEKYLYQLVAYHFSVEGVFDARLMADAGLEDSTLWMLGERSADLESARADFPDADFARAEIEDIMKSSGVWIGGSREYAMELQPGEYDRIKSEITSESQKYLFNSWYRPDNERLSDPVREYLDRKAFTMPE